MVEAAHLPPTDRFAVVFPQRGKSLLAGAEPQGLRPLWGRTGGKAARWGQVSEPLYAGLRALSACAIVPSSSQSRSPPTGTPRASMVTDTPLGARRSAR